MAGLRLTVAAWKPLPHYVTFRRRFTLLELLVATMASAVLVSALLVVMGATYHLRNDGHERVQEELPRDLAARRLSAELRAAVPPAGIIAGPLIGTPVTAGDYRQDQIEWVAAIGGRSPEDLSGDLFQVRYEFTDEDGDGIGELVRSDRRNLLTVEEDEELTEVVILEDIVSFSATWYDGETWQDSWDSTVQENQLPLAAWIRLDFAERDGRQPRPLEMIVPFAMRTVSVEAAE